jgi:hypothetical protein
MSAYRAPSRRVNEGLAGVEFEQPAARVPSAWDRTAGPLHVAPRHRGEAGVSQAPAISTRDRGGPRWRDIERLVGSRLFDLDEAIPEERPLLALLGRRRLPAVVPAKILAHPGLAVTALALPAVEDHLDEVEVFETTQEVLVEIGPPLVHD